MRRLFALHTLISVGSILAGVVGCSGDAAGVDATDPAAVAPVGGIVAGDPAQSVAPGTTVAAGVGAGVGNPNPSGVVGAPVTPVVPEAPPPAIAPVSPASPATPIAPGAATAPQELRLVSTPLARLTNGEYVASLRQLLDLPAAARFPEGALESLPAEPEEGGVVNNAYHQPLSQLHIAGYDRIASAATDIFLAGMNSNDNAGLAQLLGCQTLGDEALSPCLQDFGDKLMDRAARRAPTTGRAEYTRAIIDAVIKVTEDLGIQPTNFEARRLQVSGLIAAVALSPDFLLLVESGDDGVPTNQLSAIDVANRLAFLLSGAPPDDELLAVAADGSVLQPSVRAAQVDRLLNSAASRQRVVQTLLGWLKVQPDGVDEVDYEALSAFISAWFEEELPFSEFYQGAIDVQHADGAVTSEPLGVLGSRAFVAAHTNFPSPSFITRGVFAVEELLCSELPDGIPADAFDGDPLTPVEVFEQHARQPCASCHRVFDNYGAVFQQFEPETNLFVPDRAPFGVAFDLLPLGDVSGSASGLSDLSTKLASSEHAAGCIAQVVYRLAMRRGLEGRDDAVVQAHTSAWLAGGGTLKGLIRQIVASEEFVTFFR